MRASVREGFVRFTSALEGVVPWMYQDVKGLVTVAIGNLIDPIDTALGLPFVRKVDGGPASMAEIRAEWEHVKAHPTAARQGHLALKAVTQLRLTPEGVAVLVAGKLASNENILRAQFPDFEDWPADAQLATHSMAWACGPYFPRLFPRLDVALHKADFATAANQCQMATTNNPGIVPRNEANRTLYAAAATTTDPDAVSWDLLDQRRWPPVAPAPANDVDAPAIIDGGTVHAELYDEPPPDAA